MCQIDSPISFLGHNQCTKSQNKLYSLPLIMLKLLSIFTVDYIEITVMSGWDERSMKEITSKTKVVTITVHTLLSTFTL